MKRDIVSLFPISLNFSVLFVYPDEELARAELPIPTSAAGAAVPSVESESANFFSHLDWKKY